MRNQRRQLRQQKHASIEEWLEYREVNREVKKKLKAAKEKWIEGECSNKEKEMTEETTLLIKILQHK